MARKAGIWRVASTGLAATLAAALIPLALSALASLSGDRAARTAPLTTWALSTLTARWLATVTSPLTLILSLLLIAAIVAWWVWISGHLVRPRTGGTASSLASRGPPAAASMAPRTS